MTRPQPSSRSSSRERVPRYDRPRYPADYGQNSVRVFNGNEKQPKMFCNSVIFNEDAIRNLPYQENDWEDNERSPNREADRTTNPEESSNGNYDLRRSLLENALTIAFLAANANQLRLLANQNQQDTMTYRVGFGLVILSLILQVLSGVAMLLMSTYTSQRWLLLRNLACIAATLIALLNIALVTMLDLILESA